MTRKKILIIMPAMLGGGAERILLNVLNRINFKEFEIDLVLAVKKGDLLAQIPKRVKIISLFSSTILFRIVTWLQKKINFHFVQRFIFDGKVTERYDLALCYLDGNMTDYLHYSDNIRKRVTWVHSSYVSNDNFAKFYKSKKYVNHLKFNRYFGLDKICFVSNDCKEEFQEVFGEFENMEVIYNLINTEDVIEKSLVPLEVPNSEFTFIAIGSLIPVKGYDLLIESVILLKQNGYKFVVQIVGKGSNGKLLKNKVLENNISDFVQFIGFTTNPYRYLKNADCFIMTSLSEANPTALCEALVLGKPCIAVNVPGCREIIGNGKFGIIVERNAKDVMIGMEKVLTNSKLRLELEEKAKLRANDFVDEVILQKYTEVLNS